jgi:hypothetical protein
VSRYALIRRRLAPVAFVIGMGVIVQQTCTKQQRTHATIELDLGALAASAQTVDAELFIGPDSIAKFHRVSVPGLRSRPDRFEVAMPAPDGELHIDVDLGAEHRAVIRGIHADEGAVIKVRAY